MPLWWRPLPADRSSQGAQLGHTPAPLLLQISSSGGWGDGEGAALAVVGAEGHGQDLLPPMGGGGGAGNQEEVGVIGSPQSRHCWAFTVSSCCPNGPAGGSCLPLFQMIKQV